MAGCNNHGCQCRPMPRARRPAQHRVLDPPPPAKAPEPRLPHKFFHAVPHYGLEGVKKVPHRLAHWLRTGSGSGPEPRVLGCLLRPPPPPCLLLPIALCSALQETFGRWRRPAPAVPCKQAERVCGCLQRGKGGAGRGVLPSPMPRLWRVWHEPAPTLWRLPPTSRSPSESGTLLTNTSALCCFPAFCEVPFSHIRGSRRRPKPTFPPWWVACRPWLGVFFAQAIGNGKVHLVHVGWGRVRHIAARPSLGLPPGGPPQH
jgi:hypothetical protein